MLSCHDQVVEVLFGACFLEREDTLNYYEEDNTKGKNVNFISIVYFSLFDLRSHVGHSSAVALQTIDVLIASKSEVSNLQVEVVVD